MALCWMPRTGRSRRSEQPATAPPAAAPRGRLRSGARGPRRVATGSDLPCLEPAATDLQQSVGLPSMPRGHLPEPQPNRSTDGKRPQSHASRKHLEEAIRNRRDFLGGGRLRGSAKPGPLYRRSSTCCTCRNAALEQWPKIVLKSRQADPALANKEERFYASI